MSTRRTDSSSLRLANGRFAGNAARRRTGSLLAAAAVAGFSASAWATSRNYVGPNNGNFNTAANWSPSGVPASNDDLFLGNVNPMGLTGNVNVTLNTTTNILESVTINSFGVPEYMILNETAGGTLMALNGNATETLGSVTSENAFNQSGGSSNQTFVLNIGVSSINNTYTLSGANTNLDVLFNMNLGIGGSGLFNQSSGVVVVDAGSFDDYSAVFASGVNAGGFGTYNLTGGTFEADTADLGGAGSSVFTLDGGTFACSTVNIGSTTAGDQSVFNYYLGAFGGFSPSEPVVTIASGGVFNLEAGATFNPSGPTLLSVNAGGTFNFLGGVAGNEAEIELNGGLIQLNGGNATATSLIGTLGTIQNSGLTPSVLTVDDALEIGFPNPFLAAISSNIVDGGIGSMGLNVPAADGVILSGVNTYSGPTTIGAAGAIQAQSNGAFSPNSNYTLTSGTLDAATSNVTTGSIAGSGDVNIASAGTLTTGSTNLSTALSAVLTGSGDFNKVGTGTMTMTGGGPFTGTIIIEQGAITIGATNGIPTGAIVLMGGIASLNVGASQTLASFSSGPADTVGFSLFSTLTIGGANTSTEIGGVFNGLGEFIKTGSGTLTDGYGTSDITPDTDSSLTITVNAGTLTLAKATGIDAVAGPLIIGGGTVLLTNSNLIDPGSVVTINSGLLNLNGLNDTIGSLQGAAGGNVNLGGGTLTVQQAFNTTYGGGLSGAGQFNKNGVGTITLTSVGNFGGAFNANGGLLVLEGPVTSTGFTANSGGNLEFFGSTVNLSNTPIISNAGGTVLYVGANINNGFLRGAGAHVITGAGTSSFSGVQTFNSATISQNGAASFNDFTNGGTFNNNSALTLAGAVNDTSGILNVNNVVNTQDFTNNGVMNVAAGGKIVNSLSALYLGGGSRMYIGTVPAPGGTLTLQGTTTLEVNGALLVNEGVISGTTDVNFGGVAMGAGTYGPVNVTYGGLFQPGFTAMGASIPTQGAIVTSLAGAGTVDNQSAGGSLELTDDSAAVSTFSGVIQNTTGTLGITLSGPGGLTLLTSTLPGGIQSTNTYAGGTSISGGSTLNIGAVNALPAGGAVANNGAFNVLAHSVAGNISGSGTTTVGPSAKLQIAANSGVSTQGSLVINSSSALDVTNNEFLLNYGTSTDPIGSIQSYLAGGYAGGAWNGNGINSSTVAGLNGSSSLRYAIGYIDGALPPVNFNSGIAAGTIEILPTLAGDATLSGTVDFYDFQVVLSNFGKANQSWDQGDFDYTGTVDFYDFQVVLSNFGQNDSALTTSEFATLNNFAARFGEQVNSNLALVSVPEPASMGALGAGAMGLMARRRRRS